MARAVDAPVRFWANTVNKPVDTVKHSGEETSDRFSAVTDRAAQLTDPVKNSLTAGRSAPLRRAEQVARREGNQDADELPINNYDQLWVGDAVKAIKDLKEPHDIRVIIRYEETARAGRT